METLQRSACGRCGIAITKGSEFCLDCRSTDPWYFSAIRIKEYGPRTCSNGHVVDGDNVSWYTDSAGRVYSRCLACRRAQNRRRRGKRRVTA